ncbi:MAG TPA: 6-carboxytetrahydropterin synthase, partial [Thermoanaerobaculia bacterium]
GLDEEGLLVDLEGFKKLLRSRCARLDSVTLLPAESRRLQWSRAEGAVEVRCGERVYRFPEGDVLFLPLINTSIELLARLLWQELAPHLAGSRVDWMAVSVQESAGQRCWYEDRIQEPGI